MTCMQTAATDSQVSDFVHKARAAVGAASPDLNCKPQVPFQTDLKLTAEQEKKMIEHAFTRLHTVSNELVGDQTMNPQWWMNRTAAGQHLPLASQGLQAADTFFGKRSRYEATFLNDVSASVDDGAGQHFPVVQPRRPAEPPHLPPDDRAGQNSFFGSDPWFSVSPARCPSTICSRMRRGRRRFRTSPGLLAEANLRKDWATPLSAR